MSQLSAVVTTGIYCREDCTARPHRKNVRTFEFAAAAEAEGFRACKRCRPYRSVEVNQFVDAPEVVCKAIHLIVAGLLDTANEEALARRLGVSTRHLRRLFHDHVGATPDQLARSRRAHFARRLLDDTDLSHTEIAFASGFLSLRQFNTTMRQTFHATPREMRAQRQNKDRLVADGGVVLRLSHQRPIDFDSMLAFLSGRQINGVESISNGTYRRTIVVDGDPGVIEVCQIEGSRSATKEILVRLHLPHWRSLIHHVQRVRAIFDLDVDPSHIVDLLADCDTLGPLVRQRPGLRIPGAWDPFEMGVRAILGQQVSVAAATTLMGRLVARHGNPVEGLTEWGLTHTFPSPVAMVDADLSGLGITSRRNETVRALASAITDGSLTLDSAVDLEALQAQLIAMPGIGKWTANYLAMRLGLKDSFPVGDLVLRKAISGDGEPVTDSQLLRRAEQWRPWRAYAAMHLWADYGAKLARTKTAMTMTSGKSDSKKVPAKKLATSRRG